MTEPCKRRWEIEALLDGRLLETDHASIERHADVCTPCREELARQRDLTGLLREVPWPSATPLERRRARATLLARANERVLRGGAGGGRRRVAVGAGVVLAAAAVLLAVSRPRPAQAPVVTAPVAAPLFEVADVAHAQMEREQAGGVTRVALREGTAAFHVERVTPAARFVVAVPDGEVEVRGTRFVVEVEGGHTRSVSVTEGVVEVRVGAFFGVLRAGERWPSLEQHAVAAPSSPIAPSEQPGRLAPSARPSASASAPAAPRPPEVQPGPRFGEAMRAYRAGEYGEAERLLTAFARDFPTDSRAEDALFLVADVRARRGDAQGASAAAREYLRRYPSGLRAPAAQRLAEPPAPR